MKRNRFSEMIPPTPADFHGSVVDALNRMEAVERRRRISAVRVGALAAAAAAVVLVVCLAVMMPKRPQRQDIVTSPGEAMLTVRPTEEPEQVSMEIGQWQVSDDGSLELEWSMTATEEESLLFFGDAQPVFVNGAQLDGFDGFKLMGNLSADYVQIGRSMLGDGNGTTMQFACKGSWVDKGLPAALAIHVDVYRPTAELIDESALGTQSFENTPVWWVAGSTGKRGAMPIDWYDASGEYQTPFGSKWVTDQLSDFNNARIGKTLTTGEDALEFLKQEGAMRTALLEGFDFAEHVKSFDFIVDLGARSGEGAENLNKDAPTAPKQTAAGFALNVKNCSVQVLAAGDGNLGYSADSDRVTVRRTADGEMTALQIEADEAAEHPLVQVYVPVEDFASYAFSAENAWIISSQTFMGRVNIVSADSLVRLEVKDGSESVSIDAERSTVELSVTKSGTQSVQVSLKDESGLLLAVGEGVEDFTLSATGAGEIKAAAGYPAAEGDGYSYRRGTGALAVNVSLNEGCKMQLTEIE